MTSQPAPPRCPGLPLAHTMRFLENPFPLLLEAMDKCGSIFSLRLYGTGEWVFLCSPDAINSMYLAPHDVLAAGEIKGSTVGFMFGLNSTFSLDGEAHRQRQHIMLPYFNGPGVLRHVPLIREVTEKTIATWPLGEPFPLLAQNNRMSLEVLMSIMFGTDDQAKLKHLVDVYEYFSNTCPRSPLVGMPLLQVNLGRYSPWGKILRIREQTRNVFREEVTSRRANVHGEQSQEDIVTSLTRLENKNGSVLTDEAILDEVMTMLFAGHEGTGATLTWIVNAVLSYPGVLERLQAEIDSVVGQDEVDSSHMPHLKYLEAVIRESIRVAQASPVSGGIRLVKKPFQAEDYVVPPGRVVVACLYAMNHRQDVYEHPERFDPERFLDRKEHDDLIIFGHGSRVCLGKGLAWLELKVTLATIFQKFSLSLEAPVNKVVRQGVLFAPERGLRVIAESRFP